MIACIWSLSVLELRLQADLLQDAADEAKRPQVRAETPVVPSAEDAYREDGRRRRRQIHVPRGGVVHGARPELKRQDGALIAPAAIR
jgi:hypothetical protein